MEMHNMNGLEFYVVLRFMVYIHYQLSGGVLQNYPFAIIEEVPTKN